MAGSPTPWRPGPPAGHGMYSGERLVGVLGARSDAARAVAAVNVVAEIGFLATWLDLEHDGGDLVVAGWEEVERVVNSGVIEMVCAAGDGGTVTARIFYSTVNGDVVDRGSPAHAFEVVNTSGGTAPVVVTGPTGQSVSVNVPNGTVTRTAAQLAAVGITTRAQVSGFSLSSP